MRPVSDRWRAAVTTSHRVAQRVEVWREGVLLVPDLPVAGGSVVHDHGAVITAAASVDVADPAYLPVSPADPLMPLGSELRIHLGVRHEDGAEELLQVFAGPVVATPTWPSAGAFTVQAEGWLRYVDDDRFLAPWTPSGSTIAAISGLLRESVPGAEVQVGVPDAPVRAGLVFEESRMEAVQSLAAGLGAVVRDLPTGGFAIAPSSPPTPSPTVREFIAGPGGTLLASSAPELTRDERYNAVVATNPEDDTVRAVALVDDPESPVRWGGPFGRKVLYLSSPLLSAATVQQAAQTRLDGLRGRVRLIDAETAPDPSVEPGDWVLVRWPEAYRGRRVEEVVQVRRAEHPIGIGRSRLELRGTG